MAQLPRIQPSQSLLAAPRSSVTAADIANPYQQIAAGLGDAANMLRAKELDDAQNDGENAVFRTPDGQLQVNLKSNLGQVGRAYNRAAQQGFMARLAGDVRAGGAKIATDAKGDPAVFDAAWGGFQKQLMSSAPKEMRGAVKTMLESEGARFGLGVQESKRTRDLKVFEGNIKAEISALDDEMAALAQKGGTESDAYRERQAQLKTLVGEMVANPEFALGEKEAAIQMQRMESRHLGYGLIGKVDSVLNSQGVAAARKMSEGILTDTTLDLSPAERRFFSSMMDERINGNLAVRKAELEPVQAEAKIIKERLKLGVGIDADDVDVMAKTLEKGGNAAGAWDLRSSRAKARATMQFRGMSNADQLKALEQAKAGIAAPAPSGADQVRAPATVRNAISQAAQKHGVSANAMMKIAQIESSMNPNAKNPNSSAGGLFQFVDGTAKDYGLQNRYDAAESSDAAARLMKDNAAYLRNALGREPTDGELYLAHQQGAGGAAKLLANPNARAVDVLGSDTVSLNGGNASMTAGQFASKWVSKVDGGTADYSGMDLDLVKEMQTEITSDAKANFENMKSGFLTSTPPSSEDVGLLSRQLAMINDDDFRTEVKTFMESEAAAATFSTMPTQDREALMSALNATKEEGLSYAAQEMLGAMERTNTAVNDQIAKDPIGFAAQKQMAAPTEPLNFADPQALASGFAGRQKALDALSAGGIVDGASALRPSDLKDMKAFMAGATPQEQAQVLNVMGETLKPETMAVTSAALAGKDTNGFAMAGALYGDNPEAAEGVLRGFQLLQQNPRLAPKDDDTFKTAVSEYVPMSGFATGFEGDRQTLLDAARARYADLSAKTGDESQELNESRYQQAVNEVTGGFVNHGGEQVIAPNYGMSQGDFDTMLAKQGPQLLAGAVTEEGAPVTIENVLEEAKLKAIGPGEYLIEFQGNTFARAATDRMERDGGYQPFILDLRVKK